MAISTGGGGGTAETPTYKAKGEKLTRALVVEDVRIIEVEKKYVVPQVVFEEKKQVVYKNVTEKQTKYITKEQETTKYNVQEEDTTKYNVRDEETTRYIPKDVECEKPVLIDKLYERPVLKEKEYTLVTFKDLEAIKQAMELMPKVVQQLKAMEAKVQSLFEYKLVEREIPVDKIKWIPREVERIIWKNVEREHPKQ